MSSKNENVEMGKWLNTKKIDKKNECLRKKLEVAPIKDKKRENELRWSGNMQCIQ